MRHLMPFLGLLLTISTQGNAVPKGQSMSAREIVCQEIVDAPADGVDEKAKVIGEYTITFTKNHVEQIHIVRNDIDFGPIDTTLTNQKMQIKHGVRENDKDLAEIWNIKKVEVVEATSPSGDHFLLRINDHIYADSTIIMTIDGKKMNTTGVSTVACKGSLKFPHKISLDDRN